MRAFLENVPSSAFSLPHFAFPKNYIAFIENHSALDWVFAHFLMLFSTYKKLFIIIFRRLYQLYYRFIVTVTLLLYFRKWSKFSFAVLLFFFLKSSRFVAIFDRHFVLEFIRLYYWFIIILPGWFKACKLLIRFHVSILLLPYFASSFNLWLRHNRILLFTTFMWIFRCIGVNWVAILISILDKIVHYFWPS